MTIKDIIQLEKLHKRNEDILKAEVERLKKENERIEFEKTEYFESARNSGMKYIEIEKDRDKLLAEKKKIIKAINDRSLNKIAKWEFMDIINWLK